MIPRISALALMFLLVVATLGLGQAQTAPEGDDEAPSTSIVGAPPSPHAAPSPSSHRKSSTTHHSLSASETEVEPAKAVVRLRKDDWVFSRPTKWSKHIQRVHGDNFV